MVKVKASAGGVWKFTLWRDNFFDLTAFFIFWYDHIFCRWEFVLHAFIFVLVIFGLVIFFLVLV